MRHSLIKGHRLPSVQPVRQLHVAAAADGVQHRRMDRGFCAALGRMFSVPRGRNRLGGQCVRQGQPRVRHRVAVAGRVLGCHTGQAQEAVRKHLVEGRQNTPRLCHARLYGPLKGGMGCCETNDKGNRRRFYNSCSNA